MWIDVAAYAGMFLTSFLAATLIPAQSELVFAGLLVSGKYSVLMLLAVATAGNVLGSSVNWVLGFYLYRFRDRRWFPVREASLNKAIVWYHRFGRWSLLGSWVPFIGDPLTLVAGMLREPFVSFFLIVLFAKLMRYCVIAVVVLYGVAG